MNKSDKDTEFDDTPLREYLNEEDPIISISAKYNEGIDDFIKELKNQGMTMIIVTHEMNFAKNISNRIIFIEDGHIIEENNSLEFFNNPKTQRAKLFLDKVLYD